MASAAAAGGALTFHSIRGLGHRDVGQFRVMGSLFGWRNKNQQAATSRRVFQNDAVNITAAEWLKTTPKECQLRIRLKDGKLIHFDGFRDSDFEVLSKHFENNTQIRVHRVKLATKGWHWGEFQLKDSDLCFKVDGTPAFNIHIPNVHAVNNPSKNDVSLEFNPDDEDDDGEADDRLLEVRFVLPSGTGEDEDPTNAFRELLLEKSGAREASADAICMLADVRVLVPSARFDITMMKTSMKLHGKSNDFIVPFKSITRMFLLPGPQPTSVSFVLSLDIPLRKGNTRHPNIIIQFDEKKFLEIHLNLRDDEIAEIQKTHPNVEKDMNGREYDIITRIFKALVGKPVTVPGDFKNSSGMSCFRCSNKAFSGHLYPLNKIMIFIPKPVIILRYDEIVNVEFGRTIGSQTRMFEFKIAVKGGSEYEFSSVDRHEHQPLLDFLQKKGIRVRNLNQEKAGGGEKSFLDEELPSDDESDEDFEAASSPSESTDDEEDDDEENDTKKSGGAAATGGEGVGGGDRKRKRPGKGSSPRSSTASSGASSPSGGSPQPPAAKRLKDSAQSSSSTKRKT